MLKETLISLFSVILIVVGNNITQDYAKESMKLKPMKQKMKLIVYIIDGKKGMQNWHISQNMMNQKKWKKA